MIRSGAAEVGSAVNSNSSRLGALIAYLEKDLGKEKTGHVKRLIRAAVREGVEDFERIAADKEQVCKEILSILIAQLKEWGRLERQYREALSRLGIEVSTATNHETWSGCLKLVQALLMPTTGDGIELGQVFRQRQEKYENVIKVLTDGLSTIAKEGSRVNEELDSETVQLESLVDVGDPKKIRRDINVLAKSLRKTNSSLRTELDKATTRMQDATFQVDALRRELHSTRKAATVDELTGIFNRRALNRYLSQLLENKNRQAPWSFVIFDIDHFKNVNDEHGHTVGDEVLSGTAQALREGIRDSDFVARYGGEELALVLPGCDLSKARKIAEKLRKRVGQVRWKIERDGKILGRGRNLRVTVSGGIAEFKSNDTIESLIDRADKALYLAKQSGRNRVRTEENIASGRN